MLAQPLEPALGEGCPDQRFHCWVREPEPAFTGSTIPRDLSSAHRPCLDGAPRWRYRGLRPPDIHEEAEPMPDTVLYETRDHVAYITLNKPDKLNALDDAMLDSVLAGVRRAEEDDDVKAVVIKGNGKCFSSGWDLEEIGRMYGIEDVKSGERARRPPQRNGLLLDRRRSEKFAAILLSMKTTICQVHGYCYGAAWMIALCCDFVIASDDAMFAHTEQRLGASGTMWTLPLEILHCGPKKARELMLTGRDFGAAEAERLGLINRVVPAEKLEDEIEALTKTICLLPRD